MRTRFIAVLNMLFLAMTVVLWTAPASQAALADEKPSGAAATTEDVVHMADGRVLHGQIINETKSLVIFEYVDPNVNLKTRLTLLKDQIAHIEKDIAVEAEAAPEATAPAKPAVKPTTSTSTAATKPSDSSTSRTYGTSRVQTESTEAASFYIVPMKGQLDTDIRSEVYAKIVTEIKSLKPSMVVVELDSKDFDESFLAKMGAIDAKEIGLLNFADSGDLVRLFQNELRDIPQVVWVHDSVGMSSTVALSWKNLYMTPTARLGGMQAVLDQSGAKGWADTNVRAKMYAFWTSAAKSFLEYGLYAHELGTAMIDPEYILSASWRGRDVEWSLDSNGEFLVDGSDKRSANFSSKTAEDLCISKGTAESLDDLALLLGFREYRVLDGQAEKIVTDYQANRRRAYEDAVTTLTDIQQWLGWASGANQMKYLGKVMEGWKKILRAMETYKAVEIRLGREFNLSKETVIMNIEQLKEQIRTGGGGGGGGGRSGRLGAGGGAGTAN